MNVEWPTYHGWSNRNAPAALERPGAGTGNEVPMRPKRNGKGPGPYHKPDLLRIIERVIVRPDGCWGFDGGVAGGYYQCKFGGRSHRVHRLLYSYWRGEPKREHLHHTCHNKLCVNPWHLEPVTRRQHGARHTKTHCPQGHPYSGDNLYVNPQGGRECKACSRDRARLRWRRENWGHE